MLTQEELLAAIEAGRARAVEVQAFRSRELRKRSAAVAAAGMRPQTVPAAQFLQAAGPPAVGTLVAEGDSWFDYPLHDVLRCLEDHHGYDVESIAHAGDRIEQMAYDDGQLEKLARRIEKLLRQGTVPRAVLLSGGGNDLAGDEFAMLLNHSRSGRIAGLSAAVLDGVIDERLMDAYTTIISTISALAVEKLGRPLPILVHGYDYPYPDGRGFGGGWGFLPGPWLEPGLRQKGFDAADQRRALVVQLIDRFNEMLQRLTALPAFAHVRWIDLRGTLRSERYKADWANELHPTPKGFQAITARFADVLATLP